jgi:hypothetical protein
MISQDEFLRYLRNTAASCNGIAVTTSQLLRDIFPDRTAALASLQNHGFTLIDEDTKNDRLSFSYSSPQTGRSI